MNRTLRIAWAAAALALLVACRGPLPPRSEPPAPAPVPTTSLPAPAAADEERPAAPVSVPRRAGITPSVTPPDAMRAVARLVANLSQPACIEDRVVQRWERGYARSPQQFAREMERILPLLWWVLDELEAWSLPGEFALLPIVESWYHPAAGNAAGAYGLWQFTAATARHHGLRVDARHDERLAPHAATRAAMRLLAGLMNRFGDWRLAAMAFNAGEYRLARSLRHDATRAASAAHHLPPGLSNITYEHLAKLQALACLLSQPQRFGIELPRSAGFEPLTSVPIPGRDASLSALAGSTGIAADRLLHLNPHLAGNGHRFAGELLLPRSVALNLARAGPATSGRVVAAPAASREYQVRSGDTLGAIARRMGVRLDDLLRWNRLDPRDLLHPGTRLRLEP